MSAAPSPAELDGRDRLARLEGAFAARCDREDDMHELRRREGAESEARVMAEVKASEARTGARIDGVVAKVDATNTKIDGLVTALTTGRSLTPADTERTDGGSSSFSFTGKVSPKLVGLILAALTGAGLVGGAVNSAITEPVPAQTVNVTAGQ